MQGFDLKDIAFQKFILIMKALFSVFVHDIVSVANGAALVLPISLAHYLKRQVVAEKVEPHEQCAFLRTNECDETQGYWLCKPLVLEALEHLLRKGAVPSMLPK